MWVVLASVVAGASAAPAPLPPVPTPWQLAWQRDEVVGLLCFGINAFTDREWGDGKEDPKLFSPDRLDTRQWARAARAGGLKLVTLVAKHHDGFCLWPSAYTRHSVKSSPWKAGRGDLVREFADACRAEGLGVGVYLSPWDQHEPTYGDSPRYNEFFRNQLAELLTRYGPIAEVWFDGACGEGPNGKRQEYDWESYYAVVRKLQPGALIAICGPDVRWVGNESGVASVGETSVQGEPARWYPAECDVPIRPGWFWHPQEDAKVKGLQTLADIYFSSVGRNSVLDLGLVVNRHGLMPEPDVRRLAEFGAMVRGLYATDFAAGRPAIASSVRGRSRRFSPSRALDRSADTYWATDDGETAGRIEVDLGKPRAFDVLRVQEAIPLGERVTAWHVEAEVGGRWQALGGGTVIGHKQLLRVPLTTARRVRLVIDASKACPAIAGFGLHRLPATDDASAS